ncbi:GtrA family protein [Acidithiobacillus ferridurans]|uniref:GtrA family protein n=1 Tax=Acidithiobacillus ferridurans TaxID=1232575 RepID=UPI001C079561|nr:GtrA family protein [Acidithiobacillus ferridurans]MBU2804312.1 GtrA family protein [Acidithiobacillus ferridurans]
MSNTLHSQIFRFALTGIAGFVVDASIVWLLTQFRINAIIAQGIAFSVAVTVTWWLNRKYTFPNRADHRLLREWLRYVSANSFGAIVNNGIYVVLILTLSLMAHYPVLAVAAGSLAGLILNFTASRALVFRKPQVGHTD